MRVKTDSVDYKYFEEPNIIPIVLSDEFVQNAIDTSLELADSKLERYKNIGLSDYDASMLIMDKDVSNYFDECLKGDASPKLLANWVIVDIQSILNKEMISIKDFKVSPMNLSKLVSLIESGKISNKQGREIFQEMLKNNESPDELMKKMGTSMISDENEILNMIKEVIDLNPQSVIDYKNGKDRAVGFLVGQIMKKTQGKVNPALTNKLVVEELKRR